MWTTKILALKIGEINLHQSFDQILRSFEGSRITGQSSFATEVAFSSIKLESYIHPCLYKQIVIKWITVITQQQYIATAESLYSDARSVCCASSLQSKYDELESGESHRHPPGKVKPASERNQVSSCTMSEVCPRNRMSMHAYCLISIAFLITLNCCDVVTLLQDTSCS